MMRVDGATHVAILGLIVAGCGVPRAARDEARVLAAYTATVNTTGQRFAAARTEITKAREQAIDALEESAVVTEQTTQANLRVWEISGYKGRIALFDAMKRATQAAADDVETLRRLRE